MTSNNTNAFASTFYFFSTLKATAQKNKKSLQANARDSANLTRQTFMARRRTTANMVLPQWG